MQKKVLYLHIQTEDANILRIIFWHRAWKMRWGVINLSRVVPVPWRSFIIAQIHCPQMQI